MGANLARLAIALGAQMASVVAAISRRALRSGLGGGNASACGSWGGAASESERVVVVELGAGFGR